MQEPYLSSGWLKSTITVQLGIDKYVRETLENMPKCGSLPAINAGGFFIPNSYMLYCYRYAKTANVAGWNITQGFQQFAHAYLNKPFNSLYGEMLWIGPEPNSAESFLSRYYDEQAGTLNCFLTFALLGEKEAIQFADDVWLNIQNTLWNGAFYRYYPQDENFTECEMGNFAQIIAHYQNSRGTLPYFDRVVTDLKNKLLIYQFNSPGWGAVGVLKHADSNHQLRLQETLSAVATLQMLYPYFEQSEQNNFNQMIAGNCWRGVISSSLFSDHQFREVSDGSYANDATLQGCILLFLDGIIPNTSNLMVTPDNEVYQDSLTNFPTSQWSFNYQNQTIKIPVTQGNLSLIFGSQPVYATFPSNGIYTIKFSSNWNQIQSINKVANTSAPALQPVKVEKLDRSAALNNSVTFQQELSSKPSTTPKQTDSTSSNKSLENISLLLTLPVILTAMIAVYFLKHKNRMNNRFKQHSRRAKNN